MTHRILFVLGVLATLPLGGVASAQTDTTTSTGPKVVRLDRSGRPIATPSAPTSSLTRVTSLVGRPLVDTTGLSLGRISDLVITPDGQITTLVELPGGNITGVPFSSISLPAEVPGADSMPGASGATGFGGASPQSTAIDRFVFTGDVNLLRSAPVLPNISALDGQFPQSIGEHFGAQAGQMTLAGQSTTPAPTADSRATVPGSSPSVASAQTARRPVASTRPHRRVPLMRGTPRAHRRATPRATGTMTGASRPST